MNIISSSVHFCSYNIKQPGRMREKMQKKKSWKSLDRSRFIQFVTSKIDTLIIN